MGPRTVKNIVADEWIVEILAAGPKTAREISAVMRAQILDSWAAEHGIDMGEVEDTDLIGSAKLLANVSAVDRGLVFLHSWQLHPRLTSLERRGLVLRIQVAGERPMLWRLP